MVITLHGFGPFFGTPDSSPFVIKVMMLLKLADVAYREVRGNPFTAPRRLLPYLEDEDVTVADSTLIRLHLEEKYQLDFDAGFSAEQKATAWAVERMCEDHLYFAMLDMRWVDEANFNEGLGRHARSDIAELAIRDVEALATILGGKPFLMGEKPCAADAFVFGIVTSILTPPLNSPIRGAMQRHANLVAYCDRITRQYFSGSPLAEADHAGSRPVGVADRPHRTQQEKRAPPS